MVTSQASTMLLNGFRVSLSHDTFEAHVLELPDNTNVKPLRQIHKDWFLSWRDGTLYAIPLTTTPTTSIGTPQTLRCDEHLSLLAALVDRILPTKFPQYEAFRRRPFAFAGKKEEIVSIIAKRLRQPPQLLKYFTIRPTFTLEAKIIEPTPNTTSIGLFLTVSTKWEITADLTALNNAGVDLSGLYVVRRNTNPDERRLVGQIKGVEDPVVTLAASYDNPDFVPAAEVYLEGSKTSFARCLKTLLGRDYDLYEQARQIEEAKLLSGPAIDELLQQFHQFFQKDPVLQLTTGLSVTIHEQLAITDDHDYQTIHRAPPVQYYFNPARTKAHPYPWVGIQQFGPFSKDTFPKRSPNTRHKQSLTRRSLRASQKRGTPHSIDKKQNSLSE